MSGFAGFCDYGDSLLEEKYLWMALARRMARRISHRGPDDRGAHVSAHCALAHMRLTVNGGENGAQPVTLRREGRECTIVYDGGLTNARELRDDLESRGCSFQTGCDAEVALNAYLCYGTACAEKLDGAFSFAVDDGLRNRTFLCRDRLGAKPLFYTFQGERLAFGSEIKALFEFPGVNPVVGREGLCELFGLGPARTPGRGVFENIFELKPGHTAVFHRGGFREARYFQLQAAPHTESYEETVDSLRELLADTVERRLEPGAPLCAFLSGGAGPALVAGAASHALAREGEKLSTYSFEFEGNGEFPSSCLSSGEEEWARRASGLLGTHHTTLVCDNDRLADSLFEAVIAGDLPGTSDCGGSLLYFLRQVKKRHTVALCGACAGELFGGSPWYSLREPFDEAHFPWSGRPEARSSLLKPELREALGMEEYVSARLQETLDAVPLLRGESAEQRRLRRLSYLGIQWFLATLLERWDRCGMASGLEVRLPFADHRLVQYAWNIPWEYKCPQDRPQGLLLDAAEGLLPSGLLPPVTPCPRPRDPAYEELLKQRLTYILRDSLQPIHKVLSAQAVKELLDRESGCGALWPGQLPAHLIQMNYWLLHYNVYLRV